MSLFELVKMDGFILFWNRLYYSQYKIFYCLTHNLLGFLLKYCFFRPLYSIPVVKRRIDSLYSDYNTWIKSVNNIYENPQSGMLMFFTNAAITYVIILLFLLTANILYIIYGVGVRFFLFEHLKLFFVFIIGLAILFCQIVIWKKDSYLRYFAIFEKEGLKKKVLWCVGTVLLTVFLTIITALTFWHAEVKNGLWM